MNKYIKSFFHRGLIFGGFGPIVCGIVFLFISLFHKNFSLGASEVFIAIISTYILAFIHAGASIFNQIEEWSAAKSLFCHLSTLYVTYISCYLINSWITFDFKVILIFTAIFVIVYFLVWSIVVISIKSASKKFNKTLK